jgi:hypothetical protein
MRKLWALLPILLLALAAPAQSKLARGSASGTLSTYLCDHVACNVAPSMTHVLVHGYAGGLFQLYNGTTTLDVGSTNDVVDTSGIAAFCAGASDCTVHGVYDQVRGVLIPSPPSKVSGAMPAECTSTYACGCPFFFDPETGLPELVTSYPCEYDVSYSSLAPGPLSVVVNGKDYQNGEFGVGHSPATTPLVNGTDFLTYNWFGNIGAFPGAPWTFGYVNCSGSGVHCLGIDEETSAENYDVSVEPGGIGGAYGGAGLGGDSLQMITWDNSTHVKAYVNSSTALFDDSPPATVQSSVDPQPLIPGNHVKIACGGDCSQSQLIFRDGLISNALWGSAEFSAIQTHFNTFYAQHTTPAVCRGVTDMAELAPGSITGFNSQYPWYYAPMIGQVGYSLAQIRAGYYGPIADLNDGSTTHTYSGAQSVGSPGCGLDPAAATFCAGGCTVVKLYNQGTWSGSKRSNVHDTNLDITFASGHRPTATFAGLNSLPVMTFGGSAYGCSSAPTNAEQPLSFGVLAIAKRTSGSSTSRAFYATIGSHQLEAGFSTSGNAYFTNGVTLTEAATENTWHVLYQEEQGIGNWLPYVAGVVGTGTGSGDTGSVTGPFCIGANGSGTSPLTGVVAEVDLLATTANNAAGYASIAAAVYTQAQVTWGSLP